MTLTIPQHLAQRDRERNSYRLRGFVARVTTALAMFCMVLIFAVLAVLLVDAFATASANADTYVARGAY